MKLIFRFNKIENFQKTKIEILNYAKSILNYEVPKIVNRN